jgi:hypothetical protein
MKLYTVCIIVSCLLIQTSCKKLVTVNAPVTSITGASVFSTDATAAAVMTGLYASMSVPSATSGFRSLSMYQGLSADELTLWSGVVNTNQIAYYKNSLSAQTAGQFYPWSTIYPYIYTCNSVIDGLNRSTGLTANVKKQLLGEAQFMRAFFYFYLINLYGDVPLVLSTDYAKNASLPRAGKSTVYQQIVSDLLAAQGELIDGYVKADALTAYTTGSAERVRPNKWAATALLARAYLYGGDWPDAAAQSTLIINNTALYSLDSLSLVFQKNSTEAIWQLQPVNTGWNTEEARLFILPASGPSTSSPVYLSNSLLTSFEAGDNRKVTWVKSVTTGGKAYSYPYKYRSATLNAGVTEYLMMLRLGEQYLVRAEARAQQGDTAGAASDVNVLRRRAWLPQTSANSQAALLTAILHERRVELFTEWGHRWLDLKRTEAVDAVMTPATSLKGGTWSSNWALYPIPQSELKNDIFLTQNTGY